MGAEQARRGKGLWVVDGCRQRWLGNGEQGVRRMSQIAHTGIDFAVQKYTDTISLPPFPAPCASS
jgi:hypothetical protein